MLGSEDWFADDLVLDDHKRDRVSPDSQNSPKDCPKQTKVQPTATKSQDLYFSPPIRGIHLHRGRPAVKTIDRPATFAGW
jgi:hypothetical protein